MLPSPMDHGFVPFPWWADCSEDHSINTLHIFLQHALQSYNLFCEKKRVQESSEKDVKTVKFIFFEGLVVAKKTMRIFTLSIQQYSFKRLKIDVSAVMNEMF